MNIVCLDMEGVLVPEIWIAFAEESGIPELRRTTRDEPDYDKLMRWRIDLLRQRGLKLSAIQETISRIDPLPGAKDFLDALRKDTQVVILSDTFDQFAMPLMAKLGYPTLLCNTLEVDGEGYITRHLMRCEHSKLTTVKALQSIGYDTIASGDSYNDLEMILHSKAGFLFRGPDKIKQELTKYDVVCEDWGGETIVVPVSAKTGMGVDELLEMILLQADVMQLRANPNRLGRGIIVEAKLDKSRGPLATVLVQNGTLHVGDNIIAGLAAGRVRAMINDRGERVEAAGPSTPVEVMGFDDVPSAGDEVIAVGDDKLSRQVADERREKLKASREATMAKMSMENLFASIEEGKQLTLNLIIKADVQGSLEAITEALNKQSTEKVRINVVHGGTGAITESDILLASASQAIIIGFNVRPTSKIKDVADHENVDIRFYEIIYKLVDDIKSAMAGMLAPVQREVYLGQAEVRDTFSVPKVGVIAGSYVADGKIARNAGVRLLRDGVVVYTGKISSLKRFKDDSKEVVKGNECGVGLENFNDVKIGDIIEAFETVEEAATL